LQKLLPLFSLEVGDSVVSATSARAEGDSIVFSLIPSLGGTVRVDKGFTRGWKASLTIRNAGTGKVKIANLIPLGRGSDRVMIDSDPARLSYPASLSKSRLSRPGCGAIGVVLPDNAWELGFCDVPVEGNVSLVGLARRVAAEKSDVRRFHTIMSPGGSVRYEIYIDAHEGDWQRGLALIFRERYLYDLDRFDNTLFERKDLQWIRSSYLMLLQFAWDKTYYDAGRGRYLFDSTLLAKSRTLGFYDVYALWPTWPRLGLDERNQFDLHRDLPGGLEELRRQVEFAHRKGTRYFVSYNPWDEGTRNQNHLKGMSELLRATDADGVILDTRGESSREFQDTGDGVKPGIIMYSEGMAVPGDMPGIVAGRVHDALFMPPPLNLNKVIKPEFAIFRVLQVTEGRLHREAAVAFFNGYGTELNIMRPGRPDWIDEELHYLGRTTKILRDNSSAFLDPGWTPLLPATVDSIWVNRFSAPGKTVYTVYSLRPEGWTAPLFEAPEVAGHHYVDLWHHEEVKTVTQGGRSYLPVRVEGFSRSSLGTREEGNVDCIALFPRMLTVSRQGDSLSFGGTAGDCIVVWAGMPSYDTPHAEFPPGYRTIALHEYFGMHEEKFVVQLFGGKELLDEAVSFVPLATPRLVSKFSRTPTSLSAPPGMVVIDAGSCLLSTSGLKDPNPVVPYPDYDSGAVRFPLFFMDAYPVTNAQYKRFLDASKYRPRESANFLKHWKGGRIPRGLENHPVVWVSHEDAESYARWAGKRLPTTLEWQYAAGGGDGRKYPWGNTFDSTRCNNGAGKTTPVDAFPAGASPFGVQDLIGNVWQMVHELYDNGSYRFTLLRGGSHYYPRSSEWYVTGGPRQADQQQMQLLVSPGFDRSSTVGFRCVKDAR